MTDRPALRRCSHIRSVHPGELFVADDERSIKPKDLAERRGTRPGVLSDEPGPSKQHGNSGRMSRLASRRGTLEARQSQTKPSSSSGGEEGGCEHLPVASEEPYVDELGVVTLLQVVEDRSIVEVGQIGHVLGFLILGRVHLLQLVLLEVLGLSSVPKRKKERISSERSRQLTYVDQSGVVTLLQIVQHRRLVQVGQVGHVFGFLEFRRVHLGQLVLAELFRLREHLLFFSLSFLVNVTYRSNDSVINLSESERWRTHRNLRILF